MSHEWGRFPALAGAMVPFALTCLGCARGVDGELSADVGGSAGVGGSPTSGPTGTAGILSSGGEGGSTAGSGGAAGNAGVGESGSAGIGGSGGTAVADASGGSAGSGGSGGPMDASSDVVDSGSVVRDAAADVPCSSGGKALSFDGVSAHVTIPAAAVVTGSAVRTVEMWIYVRIVTPNWSPNHTPFEYGGTSGLQVFAVDMDVFPNMELYVNPGSNSLYFPTGITQDSWFHVAATYDGTMVHAFINGVEQGSKPPSGALATTSATLYVGSATNRNYFNGMIDEVRIWNVARSGTQIAQNMSVRLAGTEAGLVGYWRFDEGAGTTARDSSGRGHDATLAGTTLPAWVASGVTLSCR